MAVRRKRRSHEDKKWVFLNTFTMMSRHRENLPTSEFIFHAKRKWRFDWAWPELKIAVEVHGGGFVNGGHNRGRAMMADLEKLRAAILLGWRVFPFLVQEIEENPVGCIETIEAALEAPVHKPG